ncbi:zinc finger protein 385A isoform X2 [Microcaecilia unicolor]|uniref:Zinc finger protein 385A isoform X2 n=1 Tax=Microcaecilia unicolor TaxID=1415580 RepID=A0A6P7XLW5_9AMPH|nr:zinc finger protein 385A isoform X2 [Microcaecilia unicolor]
MILGSISRAGGIPTLLRTGPALVQPAPPLDVKQFLSFPMEAQPALGLFTSYNTMDPVQKAVINHTFGVPLIKTKRPVISCNVCQIRFNSESQAEAHYKGNRHARRVKGMEAAKSRQKESANRDGEKTASIGSPTSSVSETDSERAEHQNDLSITVPPACTPVIVPSSSVKSPSSESPTTALQASSLDQTRGTKSDVVKEVRPMPGSATSLTLSTNGTTGPETTLESEEDKAKKLLYCSLCKVAVNSLSQLEAHNKGTKHKTILEARSGLGPIKAYPRLGLSASGETGSQDPSTQERTFHCEICNVKVNSEVQLKQHISSRRHRDGVAGKPNPLLSRHKKQRSMAELATSLAFTKDLPKTLTAGILHNPLALAAAMAAAASSPLTLRPAPTPPLLQAPPLVHPLLRPAPGPIRTTHGPILFSPY